MSFSLAVPSIIGFIAVDSAVRVHPIPSRASFPLRILRVSRSRIEAARYLLGSHPLRAAIVRATASMWGTNVGHFRPSTPAPSLLAASPYMTCIIAMSTNVHMLLVNFPHLPSCSPPKMLSMWGDVEEFRPRPLSKLIVQTAAGC